MMCICFVRHKKGVMSLFAKLKKSKCNPSVTFSLYFSIASLQGITLVPFNNTYLLINFILIFWCFMILIKVKKNMKQTHSGSVIDNFGHINGHLHWIIFTNGRKICKTKSEMSAWRCLQLIVWAATIFLFFFKKNPRPVFVMQHNSKNESQTSLTYSLFPN